MAEICLVDLITLVVLVSHHYYGNTVSGGRQWDSSSVLWMSQRVRVRWPGSVSPATTGGLTDQWAGPAGGRGGEAGLLASGGGGRAQAGGYPGLLATAGQWSISSLSASHVQPAGWGRWPCGDWGVRSEEPHCHSLPGFQHRNNNNTVRHQHINIQSEIVNNASTLLTLICSFDYFRTPVDLFIPSEYKTTDRQFV